MQIHVTSNGERLGPFTLEEVNQRLAAGTLSPVDMAWHEGSPGWKPVASVVGVILPGGASSVAVPIGTATVVSAPLPRFGGFWIRVVACLIDTVILCVPIALLQVIFDVNTDGGAMRMSTVGSFLVIALVLSYFTVLWSSELQASFGQKVCGLRVVRASDGNRLSFLHAFARLLARALSGAILGIGYLMVAFTERKQGLHDLIVGTFVVRR